VRDFLLAAQAHPLYWAALIFFAAYPVILAIVWITTGLIFFFRREGTGSVDDEAPSGQVSCP
jgi:hypothetical protein